MYYNNSIKLLIGSLVLLTSTSFMHFSSIQHPFVQATTDRAKGLGDLYINGSKKGEIEADGDVYKNGRKIGEVEPDGDIYIGGSKKGEIEADGDVYKNGRKIGEVEPDGDIYKGGRKIGECEGVDPTKGGAVVFFFFTEELGL